MRSYQQKIRDCNEYEPHERFPERKPEGALAQDKLDENRFHNIPFSGQEFRV